ncbi:hypothetical protein VP1G_04532 [Cytospora mali]|uniref:Uncharacterized protein n=1 Tax=Cytospora mali TaxID=578113 RepID=A0A194UZU8_CYTMA|nr:hypothetical protein VP1G_04532 [Valsa mali var. pyri (nom. inval.)]
MTGRRRNTAGAEGDTPEPSYAALCLRAMGSSSSSASSTASMVTPPPGVLAHGLQLLREQLMQQALVSPRFRGSYWRIHRKSSTFWRSVDIMRPIDEIIEVANENDMYGPREVFKELDADDRWVSFVDDVHKQRQATHYLADRYRFVESDPDSDDDDGDVRCSVEDKCRDTEQAGSSSRSTFNGPCSSIPATNEKLKGAHIRSAPGPLSQASSPQLSRVHNDENDRPTETSETRSFFDRSDWEAALEDDSESSEDDEEEVETKEAESERISRLFEDFPTCVVRTERLTPSDEEYGATAMRDPSSQWISIESYKLPRRVQEYLADLSIAHAQTPQPSRDTDTKLGSGAHRWLFATSHNEFIFDMLTMNMCTKTTQKRAGTQEHGLQRCSWKFWDEPDDTNHGPQIIITEPNGKEHFLIALETFWSKMRQVSERHIAESARDTEKYSPTDKMQDVLKCTIQEVETCANDDERALVPVCAASSTTMRGQKWSTRLKQAFSRRSGQPRSLLPLCHDGEEGSSSQSEDSETERLLGSDNNHAGLLLTPSPVPKLHPLTALYLAPFTRTIDNQPTAIWVRELFCLIHPTLRRLVIDMPLRSLYPADDHLSVRATLREAFAMLRALEEFASVRDELFLDVLEPEWRAGREEEPAVWESWPRLRRLALESVAAEEGFWRGVAALRGLESLVLVRPGSLRRVCMKSGYFGGARSAGGDGLGAEDAVELPRPLKVVVAGFSYDLQTSRWAGRWKWDRIDRDNIMKVMTYDVPDSVYEGEDLVDRYYEWVKTAALNGDIWDWEGPLVMGTPKVEEPTDAVVFELEA